MANNRTIYVGDSYPADEFQISDETGVLNLSAAAGIEVQYIGNTFQFSVTGVAIWPAQQDPVLSYTWNLSATFTSADTAKADVYKIFVVVTWSAGEVQTFPTGSTLTVLAL